MSQTLDLPVAVPDLSCESVHLRELTEDDIPAWFERATDVASADLAGDPVPASVDMGGPWLQRQRDLFRRKAGIRWAIVPTGSPVSVGTIGLNIKANEERIAELGIVVARAYWSHGIGTAAARLATSYGLARLGLAAIEAEVLRRNPASIRLLEKTGFELLRVMPATATEPEELLLYALSCRGADGTNPGAQPDESMRSVVSPRSGGATPLDLNVGVRK